MNEGSLGPTCGMCDTRLLVTSCLAAPCDNGQWAILFTNYHHCLWGPPQHPPCLLVLIPEGLKMGKAEKGRDLTFNQQGLDFRGNALPLLLHSESAHQHQVSAADSVSQLRTVRLSLVFLPYALHSLTSVPLDQPAAKSFS